MMNLQRLELEGVAGPQEQDRSLTMLYQAIWIVEKLQHEQARNDLGDQIVVDRRKRLDKK